MLDFNTLSEFSRAHCIAICAFLVPANLGATISTMVLAALCRPQVQVWRSAGVATVFALVMVLHVFTWFQVGVVMPPTYILLCLGSSCLVTNILAIAYNYNTVILRKRYPNASSAINHP
ncbi:MAG: hypothetical protein AB1861_29910 [Cyanobacteriota bacterium]